MDTCHVCGAEAPELDDAGQCPTCAECEGCGLTRATCECDAEWVDTDVDDEGELDWDVRAEAMRILAAGGEL